MGPSWTLQPSLLAKALQILPQIQPLLSPPPNHVPPPTVRPFNSLPQKLHVKERSDSPWEVPGEHAPRHKPTNPCSLSRTAATTPAVALCTAVEEK